MKKAFQGKELLISSKAIAKSFKMSPEDFIRSDNVKINGEFEKSYLYRSRDERLISSASKEWGKSKYIYLLLTTKRSREME